MIDIHEPYSPERARVVAAMIRLRTGKFPYLRSEPYHTCDATEQYLHWREFLVWARGILEAP